MKELETERLILRKLKEEDAQRIYDCWASSNEATRYLTWLPHESVRTTKMILEEWVEEYEDRECYRYGIELKEIGALIGMIDVVDWIEGVPMLGYVLGEDYWDEGYMTEACAAVTEHLFEEGYPSVLVRVNEENVPSIRVLEKNGYTYLGQAEETCSKQKPWTVMINYYRKDKE